jgi:branched-chain amino acid transport system substrate-binding protein
MSRDTSAGARPLWGRTVVVIAAAVLIAAACGSDNSSSGSAATATTAVSSATTAASSATTAGSSAPSGSSSTVTDYAAYVGGSGAADASLKPIKIGYISQEGGPVEVGPTNDDGVEIGVKFINDQAGGIGGHPIQLVKCYIAATEEEGQQCGQQMANDKDIVAVLEGPVAVGAESMFAALGDKPVVSGVSVNAVDTVQ